MPSGHGIWEISLLKTPFEHNPRDQQVRKLNPHDTGLKMSFEANA